MKTDIIELGDDSDLDAQTIQTWLDAHLTATIRFIVGSLPERRLIIIYSE